MSEVAHFAIHKTARVRREIERQVVVVVLVGWSIDKARFQVPLAIGENKIDGTVLLRNQNSGFQHPEANRSIRIQGSICTGSEPLVDLV